MFAAKKSEDSLTVMDCHLESDWRDETEGNMLANCDSSGYLKIKLDPEGTSSNLASPLVLNGGLSGPKGKMKNPLDCAAFSPTQNGTKQITKETSSKHQENHWLNRVFTFCGHPFTVKFSIIFVLVLLVSTTACILTILKFTAEGKSTPPPQYIQPIPPIVRPTATQLYGTSDSSLPTVTQPKEWYLITRKDWNAYDVAYEAVYLHHPVKIVIIAHTAGGFCLKEVKCLDKMRGIQAWAVGNNNFDDIPYNFLVGGDGNAFEGTGWDIAGAHTRSYNSKSIGIAFIGHFVYIHPTPQQFEALKRLLAWGVKIGKLDPDYRLVPHNLTHASLSPGRFVYEEIKHWPHFTEDRFQIQS